MNLLSSDKHKQASFRNQEVEMITKLYDFEINTCFDTRKSQIQTKGKIKIIIECQQQINFLLRSKSTLTTDLNPRTTV